MRILVMSTTCYQTLSTLRRTRETDVSVPSPPRKRRNFLSKPGKVMKDAYFKGMQWTRTRPLEPAPSIPSTTSSIIFACCAELMSPFTQLKREKFYGTT